MIRFFLALSMLAGLIGAQAQPLYIPRDVKQAYKKGTRSPDGLPGKKYWQNTARYAITMDVHPPDRNIKGTEQITYFNNSADTLRNLVIKLFLNIHKSGAVRYSDVSMDYLTSGIHIDRCTVNGKQVPWEEPNYHFTWQRMRLPKSLLPHDSVQLSFEWHFQISFQGNREGMIDSSTYFLAYFYPRVAVYDDYSGWDRMDFTDEQEFYSDFNDYTLNVIASKNFIVWSTGTLKNPLEVLQPSIAKKLALSMTTDSTLHIAAKEDLASHQVTSQNPHNTWQWTATYIPDVAFGISDHYVWDASSVVVDDKTNRRASVQAAYNDSALDFHHMVEFSRHSLDWLSHNWPGVPYPYPKTTVFQGFSDMEYPMMVNDNTQQDPDFARLVVEHEIAHTWFPFYMGINETRYAFMDEGWATTFELLIGHADRGNEEAEQLYKQFRVNSWITDPSAEEDLPIITPANVLRGVSYGNNAYGKPSLAYLALKDVLGDELFRKCLHTFMDRWNGRHPIPWDFFNTFNKVSTKDLNWFWTNWFFSNNYIDFSIASVENTNSGYKVLIQNIGGYATPLDIRIKYSDGSNATVHQTPVLWKLNPKEAVVTLPATKKIQSLQLVGGIFMDADETNNTWNAK